MTHPQEILKGHKILIFSTELKVHHNYIYSALLEQDDGWVMRANTATNGEVCCSVFESSAYLDEHLAVFHPNFICECVKQGSLRADLLGNYFFPPMDVQDCTPMFIS